MVSFHTPSLFEINFNSYLLRTQYFNTKFWIEYELFIHAYKAGYYDKALRDLRALVEASLDTAYSKFNVEKKKYKEISQLCEQLASAGYIPGYLQRWVSAFITIANKPAHGKTPNINEKQLQMIILLGMEIISVIEDAFDEYDDANLKQ